MSIDRMSIPPISTVLTMLGVQPGRNRRSRCPVHHGNNPSALSFDDEHGVWFCHRCGIGGDAITLVREAYGLDFRDAVSVLGISDNSDPHLVRDRGFELRNRAKAGLLNWAKTLGRQLREEFRLRGRIELYGLERLRLNPDDEMGWKLLQVAYDGLPAEELETWLDRIDIGTEEQRLAAYVELRSTGRRGTF